jgi:glutamine amidotransferase
MIAVIDYKMGNLGSIMNMLRRIGAEAVLTDDPSEIEKADKLILPGVGAFDRGMENLHRLKIIPLLEEMVLEKQTPILGLCLGMQLFTHSSEEGEAQGLGWIDAQVVRFRFPTEQQENMRRLKVPHMGWNNIRLCQPLYLFDELEDEARYYFVHSYYVECNDPADVAAHTLYRSEFASALAHGPIMGVQFHPEKSLRWGMQILKRYAERE